MLVAAGAPALGTTSRGRRVRRWGCPTASALTRRRDAARPSRRSRMPSTSRSPPTSRPATATSARPSARAIDAGAVGFNLEDGRRGRDADTARGAVASASADARAVSARHLHQRPHRRDLARPLPRAREACARAACVCGGGRGRRVRPRRSASPSCCARWSRPSTGSRPPSTSWPSLGCASGRRALLRSASPRVDGLRPGARGAVHRPRRRRASSSTTAPTTAGDLRQR